MRALYIPSRNWSTGCTGLKTPPVNLGHGHEVGINIKPVFTVGVSTVTFVLAFCRFCALLVVLHSKHLFVCRVHLSKHSKLKRFEMTSRCYMMEFVLTSYSRKKNDLGKQSVTEHALHKCEYNFQK